MERLVISKLKNKCGAQFTAKLEGMLNDLSLGTEHAAAFDKFCKENATMTGELHVEKCIVYLCCSSDNVFLLGCVWCVLSLPCLRLS